MNETTNTDQPTVELLQPQWVNPPSVTDLKADLTSANSDHSTQVALIEDWIEAMKVEGRHKPKTRKGRSSTQPKVIRKQAEWRYAALSEPFLSSEDLFKVSPISWEDRKAAQQNALVLNNQFNTKIDKEAFIDEYVRTAVDEGTVFLKVGWEREEETYDAIEPVISFTDNPAFTATYQYLAELEATNPLEFRLSVPEQFKQGLEYFKQGRVVEPKITGRQEVKKTRVLRNHPTVEICDYHNVIVDPSCRGDIDKAQFVIYSFEASMSDLEKDGRYKNLKSINIENSSILGEPDHATNDSNFNFSDQPRKKFVVYEYWGYWDIDGTGIVKPIISTWVGDVMIRLEENPFPDQAHPFVDVSYLPIRKSVYGESDANLLIDNQKIIGATVRGMVDIMARSANGQTGMRKDMLDPVNKRRYERGMDYEFNQSVDPRVGIHLHTFNEIPASAQYILEMQNREAQEFTGVRPFGATNSDGIGDSATAARDVMDAASKRELGILRRLSKGLVKVGRKFIAMNAEFLEDQEVVRITNEDFVPIDREDLAGNFDLKLSISTPEDDNAKAQELAFMVQTAGPNADPGEIRMIRAEIARLRKMPDLAKRIEEYEPQPDPVQQQIQLLQVELLKAQIQNELAHAYERTAGGTLDNAKASNVQSDTDNKDLDFVERESGVTQERELQKHRAQAEANMRLKQFEHQLKSQESALKTANN